MARRPEVGRGNGVVFPSPVVILSIIAVVMAAVAFVATRGATPDEREIATPVRQETSASASPTVEPTTVEPTKKPKISAGIDLFPGVLLPADPDEQDHFNDREYHQAKRPDPEIDLIEKK